MPAPKLQAAVAEFMKRCGWSPSSPEGDMFVKKLGGTTLTWGFRFEDEHSLSQAGSPRAYAERVSEQASRHLAYDLVLTDESTQTSHWKQVLRPEVERVFSAVGNRHYGTLTSFLNRFAFEICDAYSSRVTAMLSQHFVRKPVRPLFRGGADALTACSRWVESRDSPRIMLVTGDAGGGKSVFALMLMQELQREFHGDPSRYPAPFLIWFDKQRPGLLNDLIALTLTDLGLAQTLTPTATRFLLEQGRLMFILDGFDEVSRALAQNAEENVEELGRSINQKTRGRVLLTSRASFVIQEDVFPHLKASCDESTHAEHELAPYTDKQMHEWVLENAPEGALSPPERHWQRLDTAFRASPGIRELCRTPVFLRMISEVLVSRASVASANELLEAFCSKMWERERTKRLLTLSDEQYFFAYEAIAIAVENEARLAAKDVRPLLELYFGEYCAELLSSLPHDVNALIGDLAIGPLTSPRDGSSFSFAHEVISGYFLARAMGRRLTKSERIEELWDRRLPDTVWRFFPDAITPALRAPQAAQEFLATILKNHKSGRLAWNLLRALGLPRSQWPKTLFEGKSLVGVIFDQEDLRGLSFRGADLSDVVFDRCQLDGADFGGAVLRRVSMIACGLGAVLTSPLRLGEPAELVIVRPSSPGPELFVGSEAGAAFEQLLGRPTLPKPIPDNLAEQAIVRTLSSLFKADLRRSDYPEWVKIENRLRAWVSSLALDERVAPAVARALCTLAAQVREKGWIDRNQNRPRTFVPSAQRHEEILAVVRKQTVKGVSRALEDLANQAQSELRAIAV
jgi:hypothetical protein